LEREFVVYKKGVARFQTKSTGAPRQIVDASKFTVRCCVPSKTNQTQFSDFAFINL
jgi:hypothetical protein